MMADLPIWFVAIDIAKEFGINPEEIFDWDEETFMRVVIYRKAIADREKNSK
jgi:phage portal protein BeeE